MIENPFDDFVSADQAFLYAAADGDDADTEIIALLWGDGVRVQGAAQAGRLPVIARGRQGWVRQQDVGGTPLLEVYFIDVGQGDGVLIRTPDFRHVMLDGGFPRRRQPSGKNAADFVDWKFHEDYGLERIDLDAMIASHNDEDHYGGLSDLLDTAQESELDCEGVDVGAFFHAGLSWWKNSSGDRTLGPFATQDGEGFYTQLLEDRASLTGALDSQSGKPQLQGNWRKFLEKVHQARTAGGQATPVRRLAETLGNVPGFDAPENGALRILAPLEFDVQGASAVRRFPGGDSQNTNGNSVLLRLDFKRTRILLTGDLNKNCQQSLLRDYEGHRLEFKCDVAKACHHGSEDVSVAFLQAMEPAATIISSGDDEGHDHPRAGVVAASGMTGYMTVEDDEVRTPLVYSTELARSLQLGRLLSVDISADGAQPAFTLVGGRLESSNAHLEVRRPGSINPEKRDKHLRSALVVAGLTYGLVNLRTDGERILLATMNEGKPGWTVKAFQSRF